MDIIASKSMNINDADIERLSQYPQAVIGSISLDAEALTHPVPAYQILAGQGNENAERMLNLVHTTQSMQRAKDAITAMPPKGDDDVDYGTGESADFFGDASASEEIMNIGGEVGTDSRYVLPL